MTEWGKALFPSLDDGASRASGCPPAADFWAVAQTHFCKNQTFSPGNFGDRASMIYLQEKGRGQKPSAQFPAAGNADRRADKQAVFSRFSKQSRTICKKRFRGQKSGQFWQKGSKNQFPYSRRHFYGVAAK